MGEQLVTNVQPTELLNGVDPGNFGDVMIVGGGISGIQSALDLSSAGFKVYLVERSPSIGGHMAQLDKTFPTNDCSM
jgi:heterodisulfide reductase subunit A